MSPRLLLTVVEAAEVLGIGRSTMYELIRRGEVEVVHLGRCARVPTTALEEFVKRLRTPRPLDEPAEAAS
ncbi:MAG: helix-turn-helix domain-containing protein [Actinobacteria bacterium]|nr:helix-turn-helix domain-containing protein [Actinomycetota bacterium]